MIELTSLGGDKYYLNNDLIYKIESLPDTTIVLTDGKILVVKERVEDVVDKIIEFKRKIYFQYKEGSDEKKY